MFSEEELNSDYFYIDVGANCMVEGEAGLTFLWKTGFLRSVAEFLGVDTNNNEFKVKYYPWCFTNDSCAMTITAVPGSDMYYSGHVYSQYYASIKNQDFANGYYPYQGKNEEIESLLAQDTDLRTREMAERRKRIDKEVIAESFNRSGHRITTATRGNDSRTFGVRQEHRMKLPLWGEVTAVANGRGWPKFGGSLETAAPTVFPFIVHPTRLVNQFTEGVFLTLTRVFLEILGSADPGYVLLEQQKLGTLVAKLLKISWGTADLERENSIWKDKYKYGKYGNGEMVLGSESSEIAYQRDECKKDIANAGIPILLERHLRHSAFEICYLRHRRTIRAPLGG